MPHFSTKIKNLFCKKKKRFQTSKRDANLESPEERTGEVPGVEAETSKVGFLTDVQGDIDYFNRYVEISQILYYHRNGSSQSLEMRDGTIFVYGGNLFDNGPGDIRLAKLLVSLKTRYPTRAFLLMGPRDACKLRFHAELSEMDLQRPIGSVPAIGQSKGTKPIDHAKHHNNQGESRKCSRLKWMLDETMDCRQTFEFRRQELAILQGKTKKMISSEEVAESFLQSVNPNAGFVMDYLKNSQIAVVIGETLFIHGGMIENSFRFVPYPYALRYFDRGTGEILNQVEKGLPGRRFPNDAHIQEWITEINNFARLALNDYEKHPGWRKDFKWRGGEALISYFSTRVI